MKKVKLRHSLTAVLLGLVVSATASYPAIRSISQERAIEQAEIERLDQQLVDALLNRDFPALQALLADDFEIYTVSMGVLTKEEWLHNIQRRSLNYMVVETREQPQCKK